MVIQNIHLGSQTSVINLTMNQHSLDMREADNVDTCTIKLKVPLENYRWLMAYENIFRDALKVRSLFMDPP